MATKIYKKVSRDILIEYTYDDNLSLTEPFRLLVNNKDLSRSYVAVDNSATSNSLTQQIFPIDLVRNVWAPTNPSLYSFLQVLDYPGGSLVHDRIKIYFPSNYNFGEYQGLHLQATIYDFDQKQNITLTNFTYRRDLQNLDVEIPPLFYENRSWNQTLSFDIPAPRVVSTQRNNGLAEAGSVNDIISGGVGLSLVSPLVINFQFITSIKTVGKTTTLTLNDPFIVQVPQSPELEALDLYIQESDEGDYMEIFPRWNSSFTDFVNYINNAKYVGKVYQVEYVVTTFEQNIVGKTITFLVVDNFEEKVEYRPILKYSTSLAIIDVEMRLIEVVSGEVVTRHSQYGLTPDQISKYSLNIKKVKVRGVTKAKIYSKRNFALTGVDNSIGKRSQGITDLRVLAPSLVDTSNIQAFSKSALNKARPRKIDNYFNLGEMKILLQPFDNIFKFILARRKDDSLKALDLTACREIKLVFKAETKLFEFPLYSDSTNDLSQGMCSFRINQSKYVDLKKLYQQDNSIFYITTTTEGVQTVLYTGLFIPSDLIKTSATPQLEDLNKGLIVTANDGQILDDPTLNQETAIVTRKKVTITTPSSTGATASNS